jgi:hypothetical protein
MASFHEMKVLDAVDDDVALKAFITMVIQRKRVGGNRVNGNFTGEKQRARVHPFAGQLGRNLKKEQCSRKTKSMT